MRQNAYFLQRLVPALLVLSVAAGAYLFGQKVLYPPTLRVLADQNHLYIGVAVSGWYLDDPKYARLLRREFNLLTPENAMKFGPLSPARGEYDFTEADRIVSFAEKYELQVRGHTLVWTNQLPSWLTEIAWSRDELLEILHEHITTVVGRYRGRIYAWDVVNEALSKDGTLASENFWLRGIGPEYIDLAFRWAHEADPQALLFYNEAFAEDMGAKSDGVYALVSDLLERGVPIHGVGMEMHTGVRWWSPSPEEIAANMQRLADLGLQVQITELDIRLPQPTRPEDLQEQAQRYANYLAICLQAVNCTAFVLWGLTDGVSWIPPLYPEWGSPLIFDAKYQPKPAYYAIYHLLEGR